ncbi:hypothetical protein DERF_007317 [Dermatophagoides farinae]|uniref:Uncharacterized protein n=1 Tax=Dermatophagoides farinae TaxID=6954 RepID=A0A922L301_DERFA|nr:hypothetical protein DERF_007317 [Dermatophagoides farinae]
MFWRRGFDFDLGSTNIRIVIIDVVNIEQTITITIPQIEIRMIEHQRMRQTFINILLYCGYVVTSIKIVSNIRSIDFYDTESNDPNS